MFLDAFHTTVSSRRQTDTHTPSLYDSYCDTGGSKLALGTPPITADQETHTHVHAREHML